MLQVRGPMMVSGDYSSPTMKLDVWQKDMNAIAEFAKEVGCPTPLFATTAPIYLAAMAGSRRRRYRRRLCRARRNGELQPSIGFTEAQRDLRSTF